MRNMRDALANLGLILLFVLSWAPLVSAAPITTFDSPNQFRSNNGPNSVGVPTGDQQFVGIVNVSPTAGTVVTATQGAVIRPLPFTSSTAFPTLFRRYDPFDPSLTGSWAITATNGPDGAGPILTAPITNPQLVPLVQNLQVVGTGATPTITWTLPNLVGFDVDLIRFRAINDATDDFLLNTVISVSSTSFTIPGGVLLPGVPYIFEVVLQDDATNPSFGTNTENVSNTFTQSAYLVPEPGTGALLGAGLAALASRRRRGRRLRA
jgi:hypothetical protein